MEDSTRRRLLSVRRGLGSRPRWAEFRSLVSSSVCSPLSERNSPPMLVSVCPPPGQQSCKKQPKLRRKEQLPLLYPVSSSSSFVGDGGGGGVVTSTSLFALSSSSLLSSSSSSEEPPPQPPPPPGPDSGSGDSVIVDDDDEDEDDEDDDKPDDDDDDNPPEYDILRKIGDGMLGQVFLIRKTPSPADLMALKVMKKQTVIAQRQAEHVLNEKNILAEVKHPFIVNMYHTERDDLHLYIFLEYVGGGELFRYIRALDSFTADVTRFYVVEVISAIAYLHSRQIMYRDLKPENVILDLDGHLRLIDFGFAKRVTHSTWTLCGTLKYLAPEIICKRAYTKAVDWWTLGVMTFEMLTGTPPFDDPSPEEVPNQILQGIVHYPDNLEPNAKDFVRRLLVREPHRRLGFSRTGSAEIKRHQWFKSMSWADIEAKKTAPPIVPSALFDLGSIQSPSPKKDQIHENGDVEWLPGLKWNGHSFIPIIERVAVNGEVNEHNNAITTIPGTPPNTDEEDPFIKF